MLRFVRVPAASSPKRSQVFQNVTWLFPWQSRAFKGKLKKKGRERMARIKAPHHLQRGPFRALVNCSRPSALSSCALHFFRLDHALIRGRPLQLVHNHFRTRNLHQPSAMLLAACHAVSGAARAGRAVPAASLNAGCEAPAQSRSDRSVSTQALPSRHGAHRRFSRCSVCQTIVSHSRHVCLATGRPHNAAAAALEEYVVRARL